MVNLRVNQILSFIMTKRHLTVPQRSELLDKWCTSSLYLEDFCHQKIYQLLLLIIGASSLMAHLLHIQKEMGMAHIGSNSMLLSLISKIVGLIQLKTGVLSSFFQGISFYGYNTKCCFLARTYTFRCIQNPWICVNSLMS